MNFLQKQNYNRAALLARQDYAVINATYANEVRRRQTVMWPEWILDSASGRSAVGRGSISDINPDP
jgi:hypothetical protein